MAVFELIHATRFNDITKVLMYFYLVALYVTNIVLNFWQIKNFFLTKILFFWTLCHPTKMNLGDETSFQSYKK